MMLLILLFGKTTGFAQCVFPSNMPVHDDSVSVYSITVSGATNNDLSTNGVCGIHIRFRHTVIGDMTVKLTSPAGQTLCLIGPTAPLSNTTNFTVWDIFFTPCMSPASPDPGFTDAFDNLLLWGQFGNYTGTYYPYLGCLEQLNTGTVDGTWTLTIEDVNLFDEGLIEEFELFWCDDDGINCSNCAADPGIIAQSDTSYCQGSPDLMLDLNVNHSGTAPDTNVYDAAFLIWDALDSLVSFTVSPDLSNAQPGTYTICPFSFKQEHANLLPATDTVFHRSEYVSRLLARGVCGQIAAACMQVEILSASDTLQLEFSLCPGDSLNIFGKTYKETGTFFFTNSEAPNCDSLFIIQINELDINPDILPLNPSIDCADSVIVLSVFVDLPQNETTYKWSSPNGLIIGNSNTDSITAGTPGIYIVEVNHQNCTEVDSVAVVFGAGAPEITLVADTITCRDSARIYYSSPETLSELVWTGPSIAGEFGDHIVVIEPGVYTLSAMNEAGCTGTASIEVIEDKELPDPIFQIETINCIQDSARVRVLGLSPSDSIHWQNAVDFSTDAVDFFTKIPGKYPVEIYGLNGCFVQDTIEVTDARSFVDLILKDTVLNCANPSVAIDAQVSGSFASSEWFFNAVNFSNNLNPTVSDTGTYVLRVTTAGGCVTEDSIRVGGDFEIPNYQLINTPIRCVPDTALQRVTGDRISSINWMFGGLSIGSGDSIYIDAPGAYSLHLVFENGCMDTMSFEAAADTMKPQLSLFKTNDIDCTTSRSTIFNASHQSDYLYSWSGPSIAQILTDSIKVAQTGWYKATVRGSNGCTRTDSLFVDASTDVPSYILNIQHIDCSGPGLVEITGLQNTDSIFWQGPQPISDQTLLANITEAGEYTITFLNLSGCLVRDSITIQADTVRPEIVRLISENLDCVIDSVEIGAVAAGFIQAYIWSGPISLTTTDTVIRVGEAGPYFLSVIGDNGCVTDTLIEVNLDSSAFERHIIGDTLTCFNNKILLTLDDVTGIDTFIWYGEGLSGSDQNLTIGLPGTYFVRLTSVNGCIYTDSIEIFQDVDEPDLLLADTFYLPCNGDPVTLFYESNSTIISQQWSGNNFFSDTIQPSLDFSQVIILTITGANGCMNVDTTIVVEDKRPLEYELSYGKISCASDAMIELEELNNVARFEYILPDNTSQTDTSFIADLAGRYVLIIEGTNGCLDSMEFFVIADTLKPEVDIYYDGYLACQNTSVTLSAVVEDMQEHYQFYWTSEAGSILSSLDSMQVDVGSAGLYTVFLTDTINGCTDSASVFVNNETSTFENLILGISPPLCRGEASGYIVVESVEGGYGDVLISVEGQSVSFSDTLDQLSAGVYSIRLTDSLGCVLDSSIVLFEGSEIVFGIFGDTLIPAGGSSLLTIDSTMGFQEIIWSSGGEIICEGCTSVLVFPTVDTWYEAMIVTMDGCTALQSIFVRVFSEIKENLPNAFSPNDDGANDRYSIPPLPEISTVLLMHIYDRWGGLVYQNQNFKPQTNIGWDGTYLGRDALPGVYALLLKIELTSGETMTISGDILLLR